MEWETLADDAALERVAKALSERGIETFVVSDGKEARDKMLRLIPEGASVGASSSVTLNDIGITKEIDESGRFDSVRKKLNGISDSKERNAARRRMLSADFGIGSVQAITESGQIVVASGSGSQLSLYAFDAEKVILVVGAQKIVRDMDAALKRIYDYALPMVSERVKKLYGMPGSSVNKILIIEKERAGRMSVILVKEKLGF